MKDLQLKEKRIWHKFYAPGTPVSIDYDKTTVTRALRRTAERVPDRVAINYMGGKMTYRQLNGLVNRFARFLMAQGIKEKDKVAVIMPNLPQTIVANMAIMRIGAVAVQNNPLYTERELSYQLNDSDAVFAITLTLLVPRILKLMSETKIKKVMGCHIHSYLPFPKKQLFPLVKKAMYRKLETNETVLLFEEQINKYSDEPVEDKADWNEMGAMVYTGGTTGVSKGVMLSHRNLSCNVQQLNAALPGLDERESCTGSFPIFHSAGFTIIQDYLIWKGITHCLIPRPEPKGLFDMIKRDRPTFVTGAPTMFVGLLNIPEFRKMDLTFIKGFISGSAPLAAETIRDIKELTGATMGEAYGLTETTVLTAMTPWGGTIKPGTVGVPVPDTDIKIVDVANGTKELKTGEAGEICIKGPQVMMGYYKKPKETEEVLKKGWFYTGDIGFFDKEGYLTISDRKKDMILASGFNIYPVEVDNVLMNHPKILEVCTIGVPDSYRGETVKVYVVVKPGQTMAVDEVIAFSKEKLAAYKVPKQVEFIDELPKSPVGKILRREVREMEKKKRQGVA
ncbi:MAG TPA: long-chain fatty acid--CoA ligase [Spirochaetes bacterium]|nr:long-chain fatty acid--CoA ligase [Spirochaetota bacterium]